MGTARSGLRVLQTIGTGAACLVVTGACCCGGGEIGELSSSPPTQTLAQFQSFPADQVPRPIVRLNYYSAARQEAFFSNQEDNFSFSCNRFVLATTLPADAPSQATVDWPDGTRATYPSMSAQDIFDMMVNQPRHGLPGCDSRTPLNVTQMRPGTAVFDTDRGKAQMSAWLVTVPGNVNGELAYPAIPPSAFWKHLITQTGTPAIVSGDGRSLTYTFVGNDANAYNGLVAESSTAVAIGIQRIPNPSQAENSPPVNQRRSVTVTLQNPLGGRIVVSAYGQVIAVCPESMSAGC